MAAYASTVTLDHDRSERISRNFGMVVGKCDITNYNQVGVEITAITKFFRKDPRVIVDSFSTSGYMVRWNTTDKCFHAFYPKPTTASTVTIEASGTAGADTYVVKKSATALGVSGAGTAFTGAISGQTAAAGTEVADDTSIGEINFLAVGII